MNQTLVNGICVSSIVCHYSCKTCTAGTDQCDSCDTSHKRELTPSAGRCVCQNLFVDDGSTQTCKPCHQTCGTCLFGGND